MCQLSQNQPGKKISFPFSWGVFCRFLAFLFFLVPAFPLLWPENAEAVPPRSFVLTPPLVSTENGELGMELAVSVDTIEGLRDMLKDGAIMELSIKARLEKPRTLLPNELLTEKTLSSLIRHNPLTREFSLTPPGSEQIIVDKNLGRLITSTWQKISFPLAPLSLFQKEEAKTQYRIILEFSLRHTEVPPWLSKAFLFWSWDVVEPQTLTIPVSL